MTLETAIHELRKRNEKVPKPMRLPTEDEVAAMEAKVGVKFHPDYRRYLLEASDVVFGMFEPATITRPDSHTFLPDICTSAWKIGVSKDVLPICEDNGDYYCQSSDGKITFFSHNGWSSESWPNLATWIDEVWIRESE